MDKALIYARVSSKDQEAEGFSIPAQLKFLQEYASKNKYIIAREFIDAETAKKAGRKQFNRMLTCLKEDSSIKYILVEKTDRLLRNIKDYALVDEIIEQSDLSIHLVKENVVLSKESRSNEKFIFGIKALMAKNYSDNLSEEVKKGMLEKAAQGTYPSIAPYGYLNTKIDGKKVIVIDPETAPFIKKIFELYATGSYSLLTLRKKMLADGMIYKNGKNFYTSKVEHILKNEFYIGAFFWRGKKYENASHEPIVSKELFQQVQTKLKNPYKSKSRKGLFPYTNLMKCGICGCTLTAEIKKEKYIYYRCTGYKGNCKQPYLRQEVVESTFEDVLDSLIISDEAHDLILHGLRSSLVEKMEYHNKVVGQTERQIKFLQNRIDTAYLDKIDKKISEEFWQSHTSRWLDEKQRLTDKLASLQKADRNYLENANLVIELAKKALPLFKKQNGDQKRRLINILVSNCSYKDKKLEVELKPVFKMMMKSKKSRKWHSLADYFRTFSFEGLQLSAIKQLLIA